MALLHADAAAHYDDPAEVYTVGAGSGTVTTGAFGPGGIPAIRFSGDLTAGVERADLSPSGTTAVLGVRFRFSAAPSLRNRILQIREGATFHCNLDLNTDRTLAVYRDTTLIKNLSYTCATDTFIDVWFKANVSNSGSWEVKVYEDSDPTPVFTDSGSADTQNGGTGAWDTLGFGAACDGTTDLCAVIFLDGSGSALNDILGPKDTVTCWANAREDSALTDFSLSSGSSEAALLDDGTPDDDTTYCEESTQNGQVGVAVDPVPYPSRSILGAQLYASAKLTSGSPTVEPLAYQGSTAYLGTAQSPGSSYAYVMQPYSAMPDGTAFTTAAAFDALQWGLKLTSTSTTVRLTQVAVVVIQDRAIGRHNIVGGYQHAVSGDDNLIAGQRNTVVGSASEAHGTDVEVIGNRSVAYNLDGVERTLTGDGKFWLNGVEVSAGGSGAPTTAEYVTLATDGTLTNERVLTAGTGISIVDGGAGGNVTIAATGTGQTVLLKSGNQTVNNSTTLANVTDFSFSIGANKVVWFDMELFYTAGSAAADLKIGWSLPSGCTMRWAPMATSPGTTAFYFIPPTAGGAPTTYFIESTTPAFGTAASGNFAAHIRGLIINGANAGTVQFQFAQNTQTLADVTIMQYSLMRLTALN